MVGHEAVSKNCKLVARRGVQDRRRYLVDERPTLEVAASLKRADGHEILMNTNVVEASQTSWSHVCKKRTSAAIAAIDGGP